MKSLALCAALTSLLLVACQTTEISSDQPAYGIPSHYSSNQFLWGLVSGEVHASGRVARAEVYKSFGDYILTAVTLGLYTPWSVSIWYTETEGTHS